ncbi:MAG: exo-alpha-sialidase [Bacteroidetes bacterium]|nr:exo-alpha-sialidase [Bacteroidota bacterium]
MKVNILNDTAVSPNFEKKLSNPVCVYPLTCLLDNGDLLCLYRQGKEKHSFDGVLMVQKSTDSGVTWSDQITVYNGVSNNSPESAQTGGLCQLADGSVAVFFTVVEETASDIYIFSEEGRRLRQRLCIARSYDRGISWSKPETLHLAGVSYNVYVGSRPFLLPNGDLFVPLEATGCHGQQFTLGTISEDGGNTFLPVTITAEDETGEFSYGDPKVTILPDGRVLMLLWTFITAVEKTVAVRCCISSDNGRTWSAPVSIGVLSQIMKPLFLDAETTIAVGNVRTVPAGIRLWISYDDGKSWDTENPIQMWDVQEGKMKGTPLKGELNTYAETDEGLWNALPGYTFGTPDMVLLDDNTVLLTYYAVTHGVTHIRACRFNMV